MYIVCVFFLHANIRAIYTEQNKLDLHETRPIDANLTYKRYKILGRVLFKMCLLLRRVLDKNRDLTCSLFKCKS